MRGERGWDKLLLISYKAYWVHHPPPPPSTHTHTHTRSQIQFWPQCYASGREVSKNLILVGTIIIFQRHRMEHQPFADDSQLCHSSHPSVTDQTLLGFHGCIYDTKDWLTTLANRRQDWSNAISFIKSPRPTYIFIHLLNYCCDIFCSLVRFLPHISWCGWVGDSMYM